MFEIRHPAATILATVALTLGGNACNDADGPTTPSAVPVTSTTTSTSASPTTTDGIVDAMERAIQDEYHAEAVYSGVLADFGEVWPFANIVRAEARHAEAVAGLFSNRGLAVPNSLWNLANVPRFGTLPEACAAAAQAERDNIALYDDFLRLSLPRDVQNVFTNNRRASLEGHLPAFETCAGN